MYPDIKEVLGHRDTSPDLDGDGIVEPNEWIKMCPCFDAVEEYKDLLP
jgi:N-acetylmuramoyl-L-alanine amidase